MLDKLSLLPIKQYSVCDNKKEQKRAVLIVTAFCCIVAAASLLFTTDYQGILTPKPVQRTATACLSMDKTAKTFDLDLSELNTKTVTLADGNAVDVYVVPDIIYEEHSKTSLASRSYVAPVYGANGEFLIPNVNSSQKTYMSYKAITNKASKQYQLQQDAVTDEFGFRRYNDLYMIALGTYYTGYECGKTFRITLDTGITFNAITGDVKSDAHTDKLHQHRNGNIVEFIVDTNAIPETCSKMGDMSYADNNEFAGKIAEIEKLNERGI